MQFVVGEQFHATSKILLQNFQAEVRSGILRRGDIVKRFLKRQAVERFGAVGEQAFENIGDAILPGGSLKLRLRFDGAEQGDGRTGSLGLDDQTDAVGERYIGGMEPGGRHSQRFDGSFRPIWQSHRLGGSGRCFFRTAEAFRFDGFAGGRGLEGSDNRVIHQILFAARFTSARVTRFERFDIFIRRLAAFGSERLRPE